MVATRCKQNGKSSVVLQFAFQTCHPGLRNVAPIWIHIPTWCTFSHPTFANGDSYMLNLVTWVRRFQHLKEWGQERTQGGGHYLVAVDGRAILWHKAEVGHSPLLNNCNQAKSWHFFYYRYPKVLEEWMRVPCRTQTDHFVSKIDKNRLNRAIVQGFF